MNGSIMRTINVTIWNEFRHERENDQVRSVYPAGMHTAIGEGMGDGIAVRYATLDEPEHGLTEDTLNATDVLIWWGHKAHEEVADAVVDRVCRRVLRGMGLIVLHSAHASKVFRRLMGTSCALKWRVADEKERLWVVDPGHPIVAGIGEYVELEREEMYGEHFDIPAPDELVMISWFEGGEVMRSACTFRRGQGKIFYFRPGHQTYPTYYDGQVRRILRNAVQWAAPVERTPPNYIDHSPLEPIRKSGAN